MLHKALLFFIVGFFAFLVGPVKAELLSGQYEVQINATGSGTSWDFVYKVTVHDGAGDGTSQGLDGFAVQVPKDIVLTSIVTPKGYVGGYWALYDPSTVNSEASLSAGYKWIKWWGHDWESVYPKNTTPEFGFHAEGVVPGKKDSELVTFWAGGDTAHGYGTYSYYTTSLTSPVSPVPIPGAVWLLGSGLLGLMGLRRKYSS
jgi:hypothetical protein